MFVLGADNPDTPTVAAELVSNTLGEDLNNNNVLDANEVDYVPNFRTLDRGILFNASGPSTADKVPWNFDLSNGGWVPVRHPQSLVVGLTNNNPSWEYKLSGVCGFQTSGSPPGANKYGIWHTGDGDPATPSGNVCDTYPVPHDSGSPRRVEMIFDVLQSPIIAKVNQVPDARGFNYGVEFQRLGLNVNDEVVRVGYSAAGINIDNDLDVDSSNCFGCQEIDAYYLRLGGWPYGTVANFGGGHSFAAAYTISPTSTSPHQRTFGPFNDPNGGMPNDCTAATCISNAQCTGAGAPAPCCTGAGTGTCTGKGETGFTGFITASVTRTSPIPLARPDYVKFPQQPGTPTPGVCSPPATNPGAPCQLDADCPGGGANSCFKEQITIAGPVRNFELTLVGFEGGFATETLQGTSAPESVGVSNNGPAGNRWGIALGFYSIEGTALRFDYGFGIDDVVFEWDETHPLDESAFVPPHTPACNRFSPTGAGGLPAGHQCATITVDRQNVYECEEALQITVDDPKLAAATPSIQGTI